MIASTSAFEIGAGAAGAAAADAVAVDPAGAVDAAGEEDDALGVDAAAFDPKIAFTMLPKMLMLSPPAVRLSQWRWERLRVQA